MPHPRSPSRHFIRYVTFGALWLASACVTTRDRAADAPPEQGPTDSFMMTPSRSVGAPQIEVQNLAGVEREEAAAWLRSVEVPLAACRPSNPGLVHIAIRARPNGTIIRVLDSTALEDVTLGCIMSAMSLLDAEGVAPSVLEPTDDTRQLNPSDTPPTIRSQLTISW